MDIAIQAVGWIGMVLIVGAYFLISCDHVTSTNRGYKLMNIVGSTGVSINVLYQKAWPALALQIVWIVITLVSFRKKKG